MVLGSSSFAFAVVMACAVAQAGAQASRPTTEARLATADGGVTLFAPKTPLRLELVPKAGQRRFRLELAVPPEARVEDLPEVVALGDGDERLVVPFLLVVEPDRPAGPLRCELVLRDPTSRDVLRRVPVEFATALGADFLRFGYEAAGDRLAARSAKAENGAPTSSVVRPGYCGARALRLVVPEGGARHEVFRATARADAIPLARFPWLSFAVRGSAATTSRVRIEADARTIEVPLVRGAPGDTWTRVALDLRAELGSAPARVTGITFELGNGTLDLDELAIGANAEPTAADRLRDLCERYAGTGDAATRAALAPELAKLDRSGLAADAAVDLVLLEHALALDAALAPLPAKVAGEPAGAARFAAMVRHQQMLTETPEELVAIGREAVREHQRLLAELAPKIAPGKTWREVVDLLRERHPSAKELPELSQKNWRDALEFTLARDLVTVPLAARHGMVEPVTDGPLSRTYAFGGYGGARRSPEGYTGTFLVSPPAVWMNEREAEERLRGNHYAWCRVVALHEMVPGHHLQTVVHEMRPLSTFRKRFYSTLFAEGWALYCEDVLAEAGYCEAPDVRFAWLQMRLWRAARIVMDASLQTGRMTKDEAVRFFVDEAALLPENAAAEIARDIDAPTRPLSYFMGYRKIAELERDLRAREGTAFSARAFRDRLLAFGPIPIAAIRKGFGL